MVTKTKPALHIKKGDKIVFTSQVSGEQKVDTVVKVEASDDGYSNEMVKVTFPSVKVELLDGKKWEVSPKSTLKFPVNQQVEYVV